jgi:hypothetical protein
MNKLDLKNGMIVKNKNNALLVVMKPFGIYDFILISNQGYLTSNDFDENLQGEYFDQNTIVEIYDIDMSKENFESNSSKAAVGVLNALRERYLFPIGYKKCFV